MDYRHTMVDRAATEGHLALALRWRSVQAWTTDIHGRQSSNKGAPRAGAALALGKGMDYRHTMVDTAAEAGNSRGRRGKAGCIFKNDLYSTMIDRAATEGHLALALRWRSVKAWTTHTHTHRAAQAGSSRGRQAAAVAGGQQQRQAVCIFKNDLSSTTWSTEQQQRGTSRWRCAGAR
jgi:hypothetical protein